MRTYCIQESLVNAESEIIEDESVPLVQRRIEIEYIALISQTSICNISIGIILR